MARQKKRTCLYCYAQLTGRRDAKTCSDRCRKRLQRARLLLEQNLSEQLRYPDDTDHELDNRLGEKNILVASARMAGAMS